MPRVTRALALAAAAVFLAAPAALAQEAGMSCPASRSGGRLAAMERAKVVKQRWSSALISTTRH